MPKQVTSSWKWAFTLNNYDVDTQIHMESVCAKEGLCIIACPELAPTTGTPHLQGAVCSMVQRKDKAGVLRYPAWRPTVFGRHTFGCGRPADNGKKAEPMLIDCELPGSTCKIAFTRMTCSPQTNYEYCIKSLSQWTEEFGKPDILLDTFPLKFRPKPDWLLGDKAPAVVAAKHWAAFKRDARAAWTLCKGRKWFGPIPKSKDGFPDMEALVWLCDTQYASDVKRARYNCEWAEFDSEDEMTMWKFKQLQNVKHCRLLDGEDEKVSYRFEEKWNISMSEIDGQLSRWRMNGAIDSYLEQFRERVKGSSA